MNFSLNSNNSLPSDGTNGCLIGRAWIPGTLSGPSPIILRDHQVFDISEDFNTVTELLEQEKVLVVQGTGFNWPKPDHVRIVFLPHADEMNEALDRIEQFLKNYRERFAQ